MSRSRTFARRAAQVFIRGALRLRAQPLRLEPGPLLVVAPHPDDDVFGCGGLLAAERAAGRAVWLVVLTDGAASHPGHPRVSPPELARRRRAEAELSSARLGIDPGCVRFLGLPDGSLPRIADEEPDATIATLTALIDRLRPAALLLPQRHDGSSEHAAAHLLVLEAVARAGQPVHRLGTLVWSAHSPRLLFARLTAAEPLARFAFPGFAAAKAAAMAAHATQLEPLPPWTHPVLPEGFVGSFRFAAEYLVDETAVQPAFLWRVRQRLRHLLRGRRQGLGRPVPAAALDREYVSGAWDHFHGAAEAPRYEALRRLIVAASPRPRVLDLGCGSGRLAAALAPEEVADYLGVDLSPEALRRARALQRPAPLDRFVIGDIETWRPAPGRFDTIVCTESLDYTADPLRTARDFAATLEPGGMLIVSRHRSGNHAAFWRRLDRAFATLQAEGVPQAGGEGWEVRQLRLRARGGAALKIAPSAPASAVVPPPCAES